MADMFVANRYFQAERFERCRRSEVRRRSRQIPVRLLPFGEGAVGERSEGEPAAGREQAAQARNAACEVHEPLQREVRDDQVEWSGSIGMFAIHHRELHVAASLEMGACALNHCRGDVGHRPVGIRQPVDQLAPEQPGAAPDLEHARTGRQR